MKKISWLIAPIALLVVFAIPVFASAQDTYTCPLGQTISADGARCLPASGSGGINIGLVRGYSNSIINIINNVFVPVLFAIAFLTFLWGVYKYFILGATKEESRKEGRDFVFWGIIGFVVILSMWGLVAVVGNTLGLSAGGAAPNYPTL